MLYGRKQVDALLNYEWIVGRDLILDWIIKSLSTAQYVVLASKIVAWYKISFNNNDI